MMFIEVDEIDNCPLGKSNSQCLEYVLWDNQINPMQSQICKVDIELCSQG